jgi:tripartite-type tricarboxylate transporter receptor subunit TctC
LATNSARVFKLNFNFIRDIAPVASISRVPSVMVVHPSIPAKTVPEFITYAKGNPGKLHVPYRGVTPALTDLLAGQVQVMFDALPSSLPHIRAGNLRPLAATTATRLEVMPDIPTSHLQNCSSALNCRL